MQVLQNADKLGCPTEVIGLVDVHEPVKTVDEALHELSFEHGDEPLKMTGTAVRFKRP